MAHLFKHKKKMYNELKSNVLFMNYSASVLYATRRYLRRGFARPNISGLDWEEYCILWFWWMGCDSDWRRNGIKIYIDIYIDMRAVAFLFIWSLGDRIKSHIYYIFINLKANIWVLIVCFASIQSTEVVFNGRECERTWTAKHIRIAVW